MKVFQWTRIEGGGYRRESFYQSENGVHLDNYGKNQKIYNPFSNDWDCCYEFGELSSDEAAMDDDNYDDEYPLMPPLSAAVADQASSFNAPLTDPLVPTVEPTLLLLLNPPLLLKQDLLLLLVWLKCLSSGRNLKPPSLCMTCMASLRLFLSPPDLPPSMRRGVRSFHWLSDSGGMILNFLNPQLHLLPWNF